MDFNFSKLLPTTAISLIAVTSILSADYEDAQLRNLENRVSSLEQRKGSCGMVNPPARPPISDCSDLFITGDFLWWEAHENGLEYAIKNDDGTTFINNGNIKKPDFQWDPGFRVGVGYNMPHDGWDVYANWTRFYTRAKGHRASAPIGGTVNDTYMDTNFFDSPSPEDITISEARSRWKLHLNQIDLTLGREFFVSKWLTLRPHMGLRSAWIRQKYTIHYDGTISSINLAGLPIGQRTDTFLSMTNRYWGIGLVGGLNTQWGIGGGFSIYGDLDLSMLYGFFRNNQKQREEVSNIEQFHVRNRFHLGRAITDLAMGLRWQGGFGGCDCDDPSFNFLIQAGWEHHVYFGQNQLIRTTDDVNPGHIVGNQGDLTLQGWTLSAKLDF